MRRNSSSLRFVLTLSLLAGLFFGAAGRSLAREERVTNPVPMQALNELNIVISEIRTRGPEGGDDEFIELFNPSGVTKSIPNGQIWGSNNAGTTSKCADINITLGPGEHYLLVNNSASQALKNLADKTYSSGIADDGGIALFDGNPNSNGIQVDAIGMSIDSKYLEGTPLKPLTKNVDQSYERKSPASLYSCIDTDNNKADFQLNTSSSNPQNSGSLPTPCLAVTNVTSQIDDTNPFTTSASPIPIDISFSNNVNVTGNPTLLLETGDTDRNATYTSGSGTNTLTFTYTVQAGDNTNDLDYVSSTALSLNGGSITGAIGKAILILPRPGATYSLGANKDIKIDNGIPPKVISIMRQSPISENTDADVLVFRVTFSEGVTEVDASDFKVHPNDAPEPSTTATVAGVSPINNSVYDVTVSGGDLAGFNGKVGLDLNSSTNIKDFVGNFLVLQEPSVDETYTVSNTFTVTVERAAEQLPNDDTVPVNYMVEFSQAINVSTFTVTDVTQNGNAAIITWNITDSGNHKTFSLSATEIGGNGTIIPSIAAGKVNNTMGVGNQASTTVTVNGNVVNFLDNVPPAVTVNQEINQSDPTNVLPIRFIVKFSEPINVSTFAVSDITQTGTAKGITWNLENTGDNKKFKLSATASGYGTLKPIIEANRVLDLVGLNNTKSISTDNQVDYEKPLTVTVNQAAKQKDPTIDLPIEFTVVFSQAIAPSTFTVEDIKQTGTVTGVKWSIINSGDNRKFTLSAIDTDGYSYGTFVPVIPAGKVKSANGSLDNFASTSTDGEVTYVQGTKSVVISEVGWMGTKANSSHEWIELYNTTGKPINLDGWRLISFRWSGSQFYKNLDIALKGIITRRVSDSQNDPSGYFLLVTNEKAIEFPGTKITYDQKYSGSLYNSGEILLLCTPYNITVAKNCDVNHKTLLADFINGRLSASGTIRPWPAGSSSTYGSMERANWRSDENFAYYTHTGANPHEGVDANGNAIWGTPKYSNWAYTVTATPSPTAYPTRTATPLPGKPPILVLNEVLARAGTDWNADGRVDVYDEFIEVINAGTSNLNLSNYRLSLASAPASMFSLPSQTLKPGERMVFYGSQSGLQLKDSGDTVRLLRASNNSLVDAVTYPIADVLDSSVCRYADGYGSWIVGCYPTPGLPNALTGGRLPSPIGGQPVCNLPDSTPREFVLAECEETGGSGMWNPAYWDSFPGEGQEVWISDPHNKWLAVYQ
ncbi:MAG: lamin tail domain-containing protein [Anaerolineales bacterium]|nr:MAG: lamin tail domain-containing protein [Anaerolineales bacterium]